MSKVRVERNIADRILSLETGVLARQACGSVVAQYGDTVVLAAAVAEPDRRGVPFLPLSIEYREKQYAAGQFPGGILKREGRPTIKEVLTCRLIDRPARPLFPKGYHEEIQVHVWVLSFDGENDPDVVAMIAASAALAISDIPWDGPTASTRIGLVGDEFVINPTHEERETSELDLLVSSLADAVVMVEGQCEVLEEEDLVTAIECGHEVNGEIVTLINDLVEKAGKPKRAWEPYVNTDAAMAALGEEWYKKFVVVHHTEGSKARYKAIGALKSEAIEALCDAEKEGAPTAREISEAFGALEDRALREDIRANKRADGRATDQVRPLDSMVAVLPRTHGSAVFTRGETQVLATATLGTVGDEQRILDPLVETPSQKFLLHYNFPPFSVGEVRPVRGTGRREIGHGTLARRALLPVMPERDDFPYTVRIVADVTESNGSSSMASVCSATLALMDAGVPIKQPVAGIAMGLIKEEGKFYILTDIAGAEDHHGDMDFKVAGSQNGVTAIQMDLKVQGVTMDILRKALEQARLARIEILRNMLAAIGRPREEISEHAPRLLQVKIAPDLIGKLIGPGGKTIKGLQEKYSVNIDVEDDGTVTVSSNNAAGAEQAANHIEMMGRQAEVGAIYEGTVTDIKEFGAIVSLFPGTDGLCHISELSGDYVRSVRDVCDVGDVIKVKVLSVENNRVRLSRKALTEEEAK